MTTNLTLLSVDRIWEAADHNGLTDLIEFRGDFYCCFREGVSHAGNGNGCIRILQSKNRQDWTSVAYIKMEGFDLRDPHFSIMPDGKLMLSLGGSLYKGKHYEGCYSQVSFSSDGVHWSPIHKIPLPNEWIWRVTWNHKIGYGFSYRLSDPRKMTKPSILTLFKTTDGMTYHPITELHLRNRPSEATIHFLKDDTMVALLRRRGYAWIGSSPYPYSNWKWNHCQHCIGGPNFLILPNGQMVAGGRDFNRDSDDSKGYTIGTTAVGFMTLKHYQPQLFLPSGGDNGYPGMLFKDGILYISYYSSHEKKACIYFAKIQIV